MMWYLQSQRCHLRLSNHRGHPRLPEYSSDSLISISVILWFEQSHPLLVLLEKRRGVPPHSSVLTIVCFRELSLSRLSTSSPHFSTFFCCFSMFIFTSQGTHTRDRAVYLSFRRHLNVSHELDWDKRMILTFPGKMHPGTHTRMLEKSVV